MGLARELLLRGSESQWLAGQLSGRRFVQRAVTRFLPGETMDDAIDAAVTLGEQGISSILTLLGENVDDAEAANAVAREYTTLLERASPDGLDADISVKPTHLGLDQGFDVALANLETLVAAAAGKGRLIAVDMESTRYADLTLDLYRKLRSGHENVGVCLQSYLYRTAEDLEALLPLSPLIRLVKGAYKEPADLAYPKKRDVDANFLRLAGVLLDAAAAGTARVAFGTHDEAMIGEVNRRAASMGVAREAYEFQMLYGIRRDLQSRLAASGYGMRVLISYGAYWFPWYMRRLAERPANVAFVMKSMLRD
jgi:proline dehydrogenase